MNRPKPFKHQADILEESKDQESFAVFWEQGTGKTRLVLDTVAHLTRCGHIDSVLVLAPNGVHRVWIEDEVPKWIGTGFPRHYYTSDKVPTIAHKRALAECEDAAFSMVAMGYAAFMTVAGKAFAQRYLKGRRTMMVLDESTAIKSPGIKTTKTVLAAGKHAAYRRILTGTPVANNPFDLYAQMCFLYPRFWADQGFNSYTEFKVYFGIWKTGYNEEVKREFTYVVAFRNLDELHRILAPHCSRITKDAVLDLPPKLYSKRHFELTPKQRRVYREIRDETMTFLETGEFIAAPLAITRLLRLQQITSNYLVDEDGNVVEIDEQNPRLACLGTLLEEVFYQAIIWARFRRDIDQIMDLLGDKAVRYDGQTSNEDRAKAIKAFQAGEVQYFVGNPAAAGMGLTLTKARTVIYYNNSFKLVDRLQSEDRAHRIGQPHPVEYVDIVAPNTVDTYIVSALRNKINIAAVITGDELKEWI